jgi:hypothetical protein
MFEPDRLAQFDGMLSGARSASCSCLSDLDQKPAEEQVRLKANDVRLKRHWSSDPRRQRAERHPRRVVALLQMA